MNAYQKAKEKARKEALNHKKAFSETGVIMSFCEVAYWKNYFYDLGKKYGLLKEFEENGII